MEKLHIYTYSFILCVVLTLALFSSVFCILAEFKKSKVMKLLFHWFIFPCFIIWVFLWISCNLYIMIDICLIIWWADKRCEIGWEIMWITRKWSILVWNCSIDMFYKCSNHRKFDRFGRKLPRFKGKEIMLPISKAKHSHHTFTYLLVSIVSCFHCIFLT